MSKGKEIAVISSEVEQALTDAMADSFEPQPIKVSIVHPTAELSVEGLPSRKTFKGVVLASRKARVFFPKFGNKELTDKVLEFTEKRPFCHSDNGVIGILYDTDWDSIAPNIKDAVVMIKDKIGLGGLICKKCPLSAFGSVSLFGVNGRGQACNDLRRLLLWSPGLSVPMILTLPPTSIRRWDSYCSTLMASNLQYNRVITEISLEKIGNGGTNYSVAKFAYMGELPADFLMELGTQVSHDGVMKPLAKALIDMFSAKEVEVTDYIGNGNGDEEF